MPIELREREDFWVLEPAWVREAPSAWLGGQASSVKKKIIIIPFC